MDKLAERARSASIKFKNYFPVTSFRFIHAKILIWKALKKRQKGDYSKSTLKLYYKACRLDSSKTNKVFLYKFFHDLGYRPPKKHCHELMHVPFFSNLAQGKNENKIHNFRELLKDFIRHNSTNGLSVVGNGAALHGAGLKDEIEQTSFIVRFNDWQNADAEDVGTRTDCWVRSTEHLESSKLQLNEINSGRFFTVISGPDPHLRWKKWDSFFSGETSATTLPLAIWKQLVAELKAPPSAGLFFLAWINQTLGSLHGVRAYGFGYSGGSYNGPNFSRGASSRHNWTGEIIILNNWIKTGLTLRPTR